MNLYEIKQIKEENSNEVIQVANKVFGLGVGILISKKNLWGYYATDNQAIVGAIILARGGKDEGFIQWIFVDPIAQGHKLATRLMDAGTQALNDEGRIKQFALVRDDNTASWNLFVKKGFKVLPLTHTLFHYSLKALNKRFEYSMVTGYSTWVKDDMSKQVTVYPKMPIVRTFLTALFLGGSVALFGLRDLEFLFFSLLTVLGLTVLRMLVAYPFARTYGKVKFMPSRGGVLLSFILGVLTQSWWPVFGMYVPKEDLWKSKAFEKNLAIQSFVTWMMMQVVFIASSYAVPDIFSSGLNYILAYVLVVHLFPMFPFDGFDSGRVYRYHKTLYFIGLIVSILTIVLFY